ncbi:uncharacterized protein METZ01_LOCUS279715 [marine metagenome]|uniref:Uncharacterized protein n=1 Tax=marine metagenome TaxID=408172 RepID=A0A382KW49_9ZZZZ
MGMIVYVKQKNTDKTHIVRSTLMELYDQEHIQ